MPLWLRSARRRPGAAVGLWLVAVLATAAAASGPMLLRAVEQSALHASLVGAPAGTADVVVSGETGTTRSMNEVLSGVQSAAAAAGQAGLFATPTVMARTSDAVAWASMAPGSVPVASGRAGLVAGAAGCSGIAVVAGRCPDTDSQLLVPAADITAGRLHLSEKVTVRAPGSRGVGFTVVGSYDPGRSVAFRSAVGDPTGTAAASAAPDLVFSMAGLARTQAALTVWARAPLVAFRLSLGQEASARSSVAAAQQATLAQNASLAFFSGLPALLDAADADRRAVGGLIFVVTAQAVALAWFSAVVVMHLIARTRGREWALGRLRGLRRRAWLSAVFGEPALLLLVGGAMGLPLGVLACRLAASWVLSAGGTVEPLRPPVLLAAALAVLVLGGALVVASLRSARAPLATLLRDGTDPPRVSRLVTVAEALVVAVTAAAVYQLSVGGTLIGSSAGLALLAPGLVATAVGLMTIRVVVGMVRRRTRRPVRTPGGLVVWRQLARTPSGLQRNIVVAIAVALAVFATQLAALSVRNQSLRADADVGAGTVLHVQVPAGSSLLQIVRSADPAGTAAMAVAERAASGDGGTSRVVAVDTDRLARISAWRASWAGLSGSKLTALLHPPAPPPILLHGRRVQLALVDISLAPSMPGDSPPAGGLAPSMHLIVADATRWYDVALGTLRDSSATLAAPIPCRQQCRIVRLQSQNDTTTTPYTAKFTLSALSTDQQPATDFAADLRQPDRWRAALSTQPQGGQLSADLVGSADGLRVALTDQLGNLAPAIAPDDAPDPLPALLASNANPTQAAAVTDAVEGTGLDNQRQLLSVVGTASVLPRALADGALVDLGYATALSDPSQSKAIQEVWLTPGPHADIRRALKVAGVTVLSTETLSAQRTELSRTGPARAAVINLALVALAALLMLAVLCATQLIDAARRRRLWRVTRRCGLSRVRMAALVLVEVAAPAAAGAALGVGSGVLAILLAGDRLPLFAEHTVGPPLDTHPAVGILAVVAAIGVAVILLSAVVAAGSESYRDRRET